MIKRSQRLGRRPTRAHIQAPVSDPAEDRGRCVPEPFEMSRAYSADAVLVQGLGEGDGHQAPAPANNRGAAARLEYTVVYQRELQGETRATADSHYEPWTYEELELLLRDDLTVRQLADQLGRT